MTASTALRVFIDHTDFDALPSEALERLSAAAEPAENELRNLVEVMLGVGCLVLNDSHLSDGNRSGNFQSGGDVSSLLFSFAETLQGQAETLRAAADADHTLRRRAEKLAKPTGRAKA